MSVIKLHARPLPDDDPFSFDFETEAQRWAGSFDTATARYWASSEPDDTERVWLTPSGLWVHTQYRWDSYYTVDQARAWLRRHGHHEAVAEHIDKVARIRAIIDRLNSYQGEDIWGDVIYRLDDYDEARTARIDAGKNDRFAFTNGAVIRYGLGSYGGSAHSPHAAGWYLET